MLHRLAFRSILPKVVLTGISFFCLQEIALAEVRQVSIETARNGNVPVTVQEAAGVSLDFSQSGERVYKVWLDDPSQLTVDFDGPLESGAQVIHLRKITGLSFANLPSGSSTLLTVVTRADNASNVYYFNIDYGATGTTGISIVPTASSATAGSMNGSGPAGYGVIRPEPIEPVELEMVRLGLQDAVGKGIIASDSPVIERVDQFLMDSATGQPQRIAASNAELPWAVIDRLAARGRNASVVNGLREV